MGTKKISELIELTQLNDDDLIVVVDNAGDATKKVTIENLINSIKELDVEQSEVITSGTLTNTSAVTTIFDNTKYKKIIFNVLAASGTGRDNRTSGIIEINAEGNPYNASCNWQIYNGSSYYMRGIAYINNVNNVNNVIVIKLNEKSSGWSSNNPTYEFIGILR